MKSKPHIDGIHRAQQAGFSLIELMVAITISLLLMVALIAVFFNISRNNSEMSKTNSQIENGRFAIQVLKNDLSHAGFWGSYVPQFDDLTLASTAIPADVPNAVPDPCAAFSSWDNTYKANLVGIPIAAYTVAPTNCTMISNQQPNTDILVVRHAEPCVAGAANCTAPAAGTLYVQNSLCAAETSGTAQATGANTIRLAAGASAISNAYLGMPITIRFTSAGSNYSLSSTISSYDGSTRTATVAAPWTTTPNGTTTYTIGIALATTGQNLKSRDCTTTADRRRFVSNIYWVRDYANTPGDGIPALVRTEFDPAAGALAHKIQPTVLVEGIEGFRAEFGIDDTVTRCNLNTAVIYTSPINRVNPSTCVADSNANNNSLPTNRGDGQPDSYVRCDAGCSAAQLSNAVAAKVYVLARSREASAGYTDDKTYTLGQAASVAPGGSYKRHVFSTFVRLANISGRRETP